MADFDDRTRTEGASSQPGARISADDDVAVSGSSKVDSLEDMGGSAASSTKEDASGRDAADDNDDEEDSIDGSTGANNVPITLVYRGKTISHALPSDGTLLDLATVIEWDMGIEMKGQKYLVPGVGLLRPTTEEALARPLADFRDKRVTLIGTETRQIEAFRSAEKLAAQRDAARRAARKSGASRSTRHRYTAREIADAKYTFHQIAPLPNLPQPERSRALLERLRDDPGIRAAMRRHRLEVGLLTEMEPLSNTQSTHEGTTRLLGLNRNQGQVIELRLWTDAYDGYRDYNTIRNTLCHELAHNRHGPHDRAFWDFCHEIERDVHTAAAMGRTVGDASGPYVPSTEEDVDDHGGWTGGSFVLGSGTSKINTSNLSRREILARAAEERRRRMDDDDPNGGNQGSGGSSS
jgi:hypothetical protein